MYLKIVNTIMSDHLLIATSSHITCVCVCNLKKSAKRNQVDMVQDLKKVSLKVKTLL